MSVTKCHSYSLNVTKYELLTKDPVQRNWGHERASYKRVGLKRARTKKS